MLTERTARPLSRWMTSKFEEEISEALKGKIVFSNELRERLKNQLFDILTSNFHISIYNLSFEEVNPQHEETQKLISEVSLGKIRIQAQFRQSEKDIFINYGILREDGPQILVSLGDYSHHSLLPREA